MTRPLSHEAGSTIIEVVIASAILVTLMAGLMSLAALAINTTENQGHLAARTTEYAQDKMEQLLTLAYDDSTSDSSVPLLTSGAMAATGTGLAKGGSSIPASPATKYVDYLDQSGNLCGSASALAVTPASARCPAPAGTAAPANWFYQRVWAIDDSTTDGTLPTNLKRITVTATIARGFGGGNKAISVLTVLKTKPF